jgi:hypothetical protein
MVPADLSPTSILVCPPVVHPSVPIGWRGRRVWVWQTASLMYPAIGPGIPRIGTGRSAGTLAAQIAVLMKPARIILVGHDLCEVGGISHAGVAEQLSSRAHQADLANPGNTYHRRASMYCTDGIMRPSTIFWHGCLADLNAIFLRAFDLSIPVLNASKHGALIKHAFPFVSAPNPVPGTINLGPTTPSRYGSLMRIDLEDECYRQLIRISKAPEEGTDYQSLIPSDDHPVIHLINHCIALDLMAASLRAHLDAATGCGEERTRRRTYALLRRRLIESLRATIGAMRWGFK